MEGIFEASQSENIPSYMAVKAASDVLEYLRAETRKALMQARRLKEQTSRDSQIACLAYAKAKRDLQAAYQHYKIASGLFYPLYARAMDGITAQSWTPETAAKAA